MASATTAITEVPEQERPAPPSGHRRTVALAAPYYLLAALAVTLWLWRDPASRTVAGNPYDADQLAWFFRYDATAIAHGHLPALITTAMNAPRGVNVMWNTFMLLPGVLLTPVTLLLGPQTALNVFMTAGFAGSSLAMFYVLRRWDVSTRRKKSRRRFAVRPGPFPTVLVTLGTDTRLSLTRGCHALNERGLR